VAEPSRTITALLAGLIAALALSAAPDPAAGADGIPLTRPSGQRAAVAPSGSPGPAAARAIRHGYLVPDERAYERAKARAARSFAPVPGAGITPLAAPSLARGWEGPQSPLYTPSDSTGAVGTTRFVTLVNRLFAIYDKSSDTPLDTGTLNELIGAGAADQVFDPQVIWDPTTQRFYYAAIDVVNSADNELAFGFSTTDSPSSGSDWCSYALAYGTSFPDYPKLGDSRDFILIGSNTFLGPVFTGADLNWIAKPPSGATCPSEDSLLHGTKHGLETAGGSHAFTPVPANEIDTKGKGWVVARATSVPASSLTLFEVTKNDNGTAKIPLKGTKLSVSKYDAPAPARQLGSADVIDTADARLTQAVAAVDPKHSNQLAIWTQHTVKGGAGAEVRWYEINPAKAKLFQSGSASSKSSFRFNGAISPDRIVNGGTKANGSKMVMNFNSSSTTAYPAILMVSKSSGGDQSSAVTVKQSPGPLGGFDCQQAPCRWGDYAAATPDPAPPSGSSLIWQTSQFASGVTTTNSTWEAWNFVASP
jgi:hypothetical protein